MRQLGTFIMPDGATWTNEKSTFGLVRTTDRFCDGSLFLVINPIYGGKEITIEFADPYCWLLPTQVDELLDLASRPEPYVFTWDNYQSFVVFDPDKPSTFTPLYPCEPVSFYIGSINLLEIIL